jgi:hypothetical protein
MFLASFRGLLIFARARETKEGDVTEQSDGIEPESADRTLKQGRTVPNPARRHKPLPLPNPRSNVETEFWHPSGLDEPI